MCCMLTFRFTTVFLSHSSDGKKWLLKEGKNPCNYPYTDVLLHHILFIDQGSHWGGPFGQENWQTLETWNIILVCWHLSYADAHYPVCIVKKYSNTHIVSHTNTQIHPEKKMLSCEYLMWYSQWWTLPFLFLHYSLFSAGLKKGLQDFNHSL